MTILSKDRVGAMLLLAFCVGYGVMSQEIRMLPFQMNAAFHARTMPEALSVLGIVLALMLLIFPGSDTKPVLRGYNWLTAALVILLMFAYALTVRPAGFLLATTLFLMVGFALLGERRPLVLVGASAPIVVGFWLLMSEVLDVYVAPLPAFLGR